MLVCLEEGCAVVSGRLGGIGVCGGNGCVVGGKNYKGKKKIKKKLGKKKEWLGVINKCDVIWRVVSSCIKKL